MQRSFSFISIFFFLVMIIWTLIDEFEMQENIIWTADCQWSCFSIMPCSWSDQHVIQGAMDFSKRNNPFCSVQFYCHWLISHRNWVKLVYFLRWLSELWPFLGLQWKIQPNLSATLLWQSGVLARGRRHFWSFMPTSKLIKIHYSQHLWTGQGCNTFTWDYCT